MIEKNLEIKANKSNIINGWINRLKQLNKYKEKSCELEGKFILEIEKNKLKIIFTNGHE